MQRGGGPFAAGELALYLEQLASGEGVLHPTFLPLHTTLLPVWIICFGSIRLELLPLSLLIRGVGIAFPFGELCGNQTATQLPENDNIQSSRE